MKNKKVLFIILVIISIFIGLIVSIYLETVPNKAGVLLPSFTWVGEYERNIDSKNYGFPFFVRSCPLSLETGNESNFRFLTPTTIFCPINLVAWGLDILLYAFLSLLVFRIIKKIFSSSELKN